MIAPVSVETLDQYWSEELAHPARAKLASSKEVLTTIIVVIVWIMGAPAEQDEEDEKVFHFDSAGVIGASTCGAEDVAATTLTPLVALFTD